MGFLFKFETLDVLEVAEEDQGVFAVGFDEGVDGSHLLEPADLSVFFGFGVDLDALPGQLADQEVEQQVAQGLEVVSPALLVPFVRGDAGVAGSAD